MQPSNASKRATSDVDRLGYERGTRHHHRRGEWLPIDTTDHSPDEAARLIDQHVAANRLVTRT